jgi:transketolase N-terminal domain/subunit
VRTIAAAGIGHVSGDFSVADILTILFFGVLHLDPGSPL